MMVERIVRMLAWLVVGAAVVRYLGADRFGLLSYAQSSVGLLMALSSLGLDAVVVKELVRNPGDRERILGSAFILKVAGSTALNLAMAAIGMVADWSTEVRWLVALVAASTIIQATYVIDFYFQSTAQSRLYAFASLGNLLSAGILRLALVWMDAPLIAFGWAIVFDAVSFAVGFAILYRGTGARIAAWRADHSTMLRLLTASWPLMAAGFALMLLVRVDQILIGHLAGSHQLGLYAAAVQLGDACLVVPAAVTASLFPAIISSKQRGPQIYHQRMQRLIAFVLWVGVAMAVTLGLAAPYIVALVFGRAFDASIEVFRILAWTGVVTAVGLAGQRWLVTEGMQSFIAWSTAVAAVVSTAVNYLCIPRYGIVGAAWTTLLAQVVCNVVCPALRAHTRQLTVWQLRAIWAPFRLALPIR